MAEERYALAFDDERESLSAVALRLLRLGTDVLYAKTPDEAWLLARQEAGRIQALLFPPGLAESDLERIAECIDQHGKGRPSLVVIGSRPDEAARARLRERGVDWAVWQPEREGALRFVVNAAMCLPRDFLPRNDPRAPTDLLASFKVDGQRRGAVVYTLSAQGAFLETPRPLPEGTSIQVEICLPDRRICVDAQVRHTTIDGQHRRPHWPVGMGVRFAPPEAAVEEALRRYVAERAEWLVV